MQLTNDFAIGCSKIDTFDSICQWFNHHLMEPIRHLLLLTFYNVINISQTQNFIKISCHSCITKCLECNGWQDIHPVLLPMDPSPAAVRAIDTERNDPVFDFETTHF